MKSKACTRFLIVLSLVAFLSTVTLNVPTGSAQNGISVAGWTYMVYMSGDSSLSSSVADDLNEMKEVGSDDNLHIIALVDQALSVDTQLFRIKTNNTESLPLSSVNSSWGNELNLGRPQTLIDFVAWTAANYPAEHFVLDLWGHGTGWGGLCPDKDDFLEPSELRLAMNTICNSGIILDVISLDACQMGMVETVYELRNAADYAIVSEKDVPISGWPYEEVLSLISDEPTVSVEDFGTGLIDAYIDWGLVNSRYSLTLSLIDLGELDGLVTALDAYSTEASTVAGYFNPEIIRARIATEEYDGSYQYDLRHLMENINSRTKYKKLEVLARAVIANLSAAVTYERHWTNAIDEPANNAHGLSIFFPSNAPSAAYTATSLSQDTTWDEFLGVMAPYFSYPMKNEVAMEVTAVSVDTDSDELTDHFEMSVGIPQLQGHEFELEVYDPSGSLTYQYSSESTGQVDIPYTPEALGAYTAAFYLWDSGELINYTYVYTGLNKEGWSSITGRVTSNIGRGLKWTQISLHEADGSLIGSTVTDFDGRYLLNVKVPTDTEGVNLTISCGLGSHRQNATLQQLFGANELDFKLETSQKYVLWLIYLAVAMNIVSIPVLILWHIRRKRTARTPSEHEETPLINDQDKTF